MQAAPAPAPSRPAFRSSHEKTASRWSEGLRLVLVVAATLGALYPLITSKAVGGVDARWYAAMAQDAVLQAREGQFPVFQGASEYNWAGGVHPLRTAPLHLMLCQGIDALTFRQFNIFAVQHLALLCSAVFGSLSMYWVGKRIRPNHPWEASGVALIYAFTPAFTGLFAYHDAYMSYTTAMTLPWVAYGNAVALGAEGRRGYVLTSVALVGTWMSHAPIGMLATLATAFTQCAVLARCRSLPWKSLAKGAAAFAGAGAYYFLSVAEVPSTGGSDPVSSVLLLLGILLGWGSLLRLLRNGERGVWLAWIAGVALCWKFGTGWAIWLAVTTAGTLVMAKLIKAHRARREHAETLILFVVSVSALAVPYFAIPQEWLRAFGYFHAGWTPLKTEMWLDFIRPAWKPPTPGTLMQPGWGFILLLAFGVFFALRWKRSVALSLYGPVAVFGLFLLPISGVTDFLVNYFPRYVAMTVNLPLGLRLLPVFVAFTLVAYLVSIAGTRTSRSLTVTIWMAALILALPSAWRVTRHLKAIQNPDDHIQSVYRNEARPITTYTYHTRPLPRHFCWGVTDPRLESRLRDPITNEVWVGPDQIAATMESKGATEIPWTYHAVPNDPTMGFIGFAPEITVPPGESRLVRVKLDAAQAPAGVWAWQGRGMYREYHLPYAGNAESFGLGEHQTRTLPFWNDSAEPYTVTHGLWRKPDMAVNPEGGRVGSLVVSEFKPEESPLRLRSFRPYTIEYTSDREAVLETFRTWLPGYRATLDGVEVPHAESANGLVAVKVPAGTHTVVVSHHLTFKLGAGLFTSAIALVVIGVGAWRNRGRPTSVVG